jgi:hypothetical protein
MPMGPTAPARHRADSVRRGQVMGARSPPLGAGIGQRGSVSGELVVGTPEALEGSSGLFFQLNARPMSRLIWPIHTGLPSKRSHVRQIRRWLRSRAVSRGFCSDRSWRRPKR